MDWDQANVALAPLWEVLGYVPELSLKQAQRPPDEILTEHQQRTEGESGYRLMDEKQKLATQPFKGEFLPEASQKKNLP